MEWQGTGGTALAKLHPGSIADSFESPALLEFYFGKAKYKINMLRLCSQPCGVQESLTARKTCRGWLNLLSEFLRGQHHARPCLHNVATLCSWSLQESLCVQLLSSPFLAMHTTTHEHFALAEYKKFLCIL